MSGAAFATLAHVQALTGKQYSQPEQERIEALLPLVSDALRWEGEKAGKDLDNMAATAPGYDSVLRLVTVDVVTRVLRQSLEGEPMSQESQSALGYTWSGTSAIPGGGIANAILNNDRKRLGLRRQRVKVVDLYDEDTRRGGDPF